MIVEERRSISSSFHNFTCSHVNSVSYHLAHLFAKFALVIYDNIVRLEEVPHCIIAAISYDSVPNPFIY